MLMDWIVYNGWRRGRINQKGFVKDHKRKLEKAEIE